jgi:hypothetical protein
MYGKGYKGAPHDYGYYEGGYGGKRGKGKGKQVDVDKKDKEIESLKNQLKKIKDKDKTLLDKGKEALNNAAALTGNGGELKCPKCGLGHTNQEKYRCRNKACKEVLRPDELLVPKACLVKAPPRNPFLGQQYQSIFLQMGAQELLEENLKKESDKPAEEQDGDITMQEPIQDDDARSKALATLATLKALDNLDPSIIAHQEKLIADMPRPKQVRATQPILDIGRLNLALSQTIEHHTKIATANQAVVDACVNAMEAAQHALQRAQKEQAEHHVESKKQIEEIRRCIALKEAETPEGLKPLPKTTKTDPAADLLLIDSQNWLAKAQCPGHLQDFFQVLLSKAEAQDQISKTTPAQVPTKDAMVSAAEAAWEAA